MFVSVPNVPGVPSVNFAPGFGQALTLLIADAIGLFFGVGATRQWGIYQGGSPVVIAETVTSFDYQQSWTISDFPVERGNFESYNKVYVPFTGNFKFTSGGSFSNRQALLNSINAIAGNLELYDIVTPEAIYRNVNIIQQDYPRAAASGLGLLSVMVRVEQVRLVGAGLFSNTQSPSNASQVNGGTVQASTPTTGSPLFGWGGSIQ